MLSDCNFIICFFLFLFKKALKHPYFRGMQESSNVNTNVNNNINNNNTNAITLQPIDNYDDINEMLKASEQPIIKQSNFNSNNHQSTNNKSSNQVHLHSLLPDNAKANVKKAAFKDSVDDIDYRHAHEMLNTSTSPVK